MNINIITKDEKITAFMQCCDVFEKFKVVLGPHVQIETESSSTEIIDKLVKSKSSDVIAIVDDTGYGWIDDTVQVVSNGKNWMSLSDLIEKMISCQ